VETTPAEESTAATVGLGGGEQLAPAADESAMIPKATARTIGSLVAEARVASDALESRATKLVVVEEQTAPPKASPGMVRPVVRPRSPPIVPRATVEEDEVEEIERAEPPLQSIRILRKCGDKVVVIEEKDTTREMKRLKSIVAGVMKQIEVSTDLWNAQLCCWRPEFVISIVHLQGITRTTEQWHQLIKRMEPLAEENKKLREAMNLSEKNI